MAVNNANASIYPLVFFFLNLLLCTTPFQCGATTDCVPDGSVFRNVDNNNSILTSSRFEFGFFNPDGSSNNSKYLGIWYNGLDPKIVVWVANRDKPLLKPNGSLVIRGGNAKLLDSMNDSKTYWSTGSRGLPNASLCLSDSGNLMLQDRRTPRDLQKGQILWQSFDHPTDTFLPGMYAEGSLNLTSWKTNNNPALGDFTLQLDKDSISLLKMGSPYYSENGVINYQKTPDQILQLLLADPDYDNTRLVMNSNGEIQLLQNGSSGWFPTWKEPEDKCSPECGFGSCNMHTNQFCKCFPSFVKGKQLNSETCSPKSDICQRNYSADVFLRMPMIQVGLPSMNDSMASREDCETLCRKDCGCVAYSCGDVDCMRASNPSEKRCYRWFSKLPVLEEEHTEGFTIFIRTAKSDVELSSRNCSPCGAYIIPYPLSTATDCGDPSYHDFLCNTTTGQVGFLTSKGTLRVSLIDLDSKKFYIQIRNSDYCDSRYIETHILSSKQSSLYNITNCNIRTDQSFPEAEQSFIEIEIEWKAPPEPACNSSSGCDVWAHTTCKATKGGTMRCICGSKFRWDGQKLKCTREKTKLALKVVLASIAGALAIILLCGVYYSHHIRKISITITRRSDEYEEDNTEGIDVPYFNWESILAATNNFADENKLGTGGFGAVYKGILPDGKEIAVKRLASVSLQGVEEFRTEVVLIAKLQHRNLVRLLGYCVKSDEKILLYEYMPNGSLDSCLFDETHSVLLDWEKRFDIISDIARGLLYLHQDSRLRIIHRDLKPSNILLDQELNAKISDFGIARIIGGKETEGSTKTVVGTYGYMSPEYAYGGVFSVKSDVFSFGVVVLETISGRRNSKLFEIEFGTSLPGQAWRLWNEDRGLDLMDKSLQQSCKQSQVLKCIHVGLLCVQEEPSDRPTMSDAVLMLSSDNGSLPPPKQPAFSTKKLPSGTASSSSGKDPSFSDPSFSDMITMSTIGR